MLPIKETSVVSVADKIILSLDGLSFKQSSEIVSKVKNRVGTIKIHDLVEMVNMYEKWVIPRLRWTRNIRVWVDCKLHDVPKMVGLRVKSIYWYSPDIISVHASGGVEMMTEAVKSAQGMEVYAVTLLPSFSRKEAKIIYGSPPRVLVSRWAKLAAKSKVHGIVCSAFEVGMLSKLPELDGVKLIVYGTRPLEKSVDDQVRVDTPGEAIRSGATHLIIDSQITRAPDPLFALSLFEEEIKKALV